MEASKVGGFSNIIQTIINTKDVSSIIPIFKEIVLKAYGEKSLDGKRFVKNKEITEGFSQTEAYSQLFMELAGDDKAATAFINGIMPKIDTKKE